MSSQGGRLTGGGHLQEVTMYITLGQNIALLAYDS